MLGRKAALIGLAVALICGVAAPARLESRGFWLAARARRVADRWFDALRGGKPWEAYGLQLHSEEKPKPKMHGGADESSADEEKSDLEKYAEKVPVAAVLALGERARPELIATSVGTDDFGHDMVVLLYRLGPDSTAGKTQNVQLVIQRRIEMDNRERWLVYTVQ